jgi:hypothetical protein
MSLMEYKQLNACAHKTCRRGIQLANLIGINPDQLDEFDWNMLKNPPEVGIVDNVQQQVDGFFSIGHEERNLLSMHICPGWAHIGRNVLLALEYQSATW